MHVTHEVLSNDDNIVTLITIMAVLDLSARGRERGFNSTSGLVNLH